MSVQRIGGTVVVMEKFDPETALELIQRYKIDVGQFVPTHFVRMLKLDPAIRAKYDISSMRSAVHAAAPCPIPIKEQMIEWWGPVIQEYYAGSEGNGFCYIGPNDWLTHKGSVGRAINCEVKICGEDGEALPRAPRARSISPAAPPGLSQRPRQGGREHQPPRLDHAWRCGLGR